MLGNYMLDAVLDKIKETIGIKKVDDTKNLIDTDDKLLVLSKKLLYLSKVL